MYNVCTAVPHYPCAAAEAASASFAGTLHKVSEEAEFLRKDHLTEVTLVRMAVTVATFVKYKGTIFREYDITADTAIKFTL